MNIRTFTVRPSLPDRLSPLMTIARNLFFSWNHSAVQLFQRIDLDLWESSYHNPVRVLSETNQERFTELLNDISFLAHMDDVALELEDYMSTTTWFSEKYTEHKNARICYFSMEFGLHESLPVYSGGLGLLAGDHLKSASDLGIPLTGVGLLYHKGYFRQYLNAEGWQQETYPELDFVNLPIDLMKDDQGQPLVFTLHYPGRDVAVQFWRVQVGRVSLYLLDTNFDQNSPEDRQITAKLYGGDNEMRVKQEVLLGIGGIRALKLLEIEPTVCHMNEGHSAFLSLERISNYITEKHLSFAEASEIVSASNVFTTHTPVAAGNDIFQPDLVERYLKPYYERLGLNREQFLGLGRQNPFDRDEPFCMTVLALRLASFSNGVSALHGVVSREMWKKIWPGLQLGEIPIDHITNGVHTPGWISAEMAQLFNRYLGPRWRYNAEDPRSWTNIDRIPDAELWRTRERRRERLVAFARSRLISQLKNRGALRADIERAGEVLDPEALTIGFARRFATYKRGALLFSDPERLERILNDKGRPVQIIFAGKAHPKDNLGKEVIKRIIQMAREPRFRSRIVFLEDYDINVAHYLVQGVDVWINTPRRPLEASGTSGMKVSVNGGLNASILDGWWDEAFTGDNGWAIGSGEEYVDLDYQDDVESRALYDILEGEIVPLFYHRGTDGIPRGWTAQVKRAYTSICGFFSTNRMVAEYFEKFYSKGSLAGKKLQEENCGKARELAAWKQHIRKQWHEVRIESVDADIAAEPKVGSVLPVRVKVHLGSVSPEDVRVEVFHGRVNVKGELTEGQALSLSLSDSLKNGSCHFGGQLPLEASGRHGYGIRVLPHHPLMTSEFEPGLIVWSDK